jgi:predicted enzyme related to lactoylglutathione lyase
MANAVVHFEVNGPNPEQAATFYSELFGWHTQSVPGDYILIDTHAGKGINGGIGRSQDGKPSVLFYVEAPDIKALLETAESSGAKTVVPVTSIPDLVTFATFLDPQGNLIGMVQSDDQQQGPGVSAGDNPDVSWFELRCADPQAAWDFYGNLFGWQVKKSEAGQPVYGEVLDETRRGISGGIGSSQDGQPHVNLYAQVDDLHKYMERAESLGGKAVVPPMDVGEGTSIAMFTDPQGTWFGLYRMRQ